MSKKININNYYNAYYIIKGKWLSINRCDHVEEKETQTSIVIPEECLNIEEKIIKNDLWEKLSLEAKEVVTTILNSPAEIVTESSKKLTIKRITKYFALLWKSKYITEKTLKEIKAWVSKL